MLYFVAFVGREVLCTEYLDGHGVLGVAREGGWNVLTRWLSGSIRQR